MRPWDELKRDFRRMVAVRRIEQTLDEVADSIPVARRTLCYILSGEIKTPGLATRDCIERFVQKGERLVGRACKLARTPGAPAPGDTGD